MTTSTAAAATAAPAPAERKSLSIVVTVAGILAALGAVVNVGPRIVVGFDDPGIVLGDGSSWDWQTYSAAAAVVAAIVVGLVAARWWWMTLLAGVVLVLFGAVLGLDPARNPGVSFTATAVGGGLVLVAVLVAAQHLIRSGRVGLGAALGACTVAARVVGRSLLGPLSLWDITMLPRIHAALAVVATVGAIAVVAAQWTGRAWPVASLPRRTVVAGGMAALLTFAPLLMSLAGKAIDPPLPSIPQLKTWMAIVIVVAVLCAGATLGVLASARAVGAAIAVGAALVGSAAPLHLAVLRTTFNGALALPWSAVLIGVVLGGAASASRWRAPLAVFGAVLSVLALLLLGGPIDGASAELLRSRPAAALILGLLVATVTVTSAVAGASVAGEGSMPVLLGVVAAAIVLAGGRALQLAMIASADPEAGWGSDYRLVWPAVLLLVSAVTIAGLMSLDRLTRRTPAGD